MYFYDNIFYLSSFFRIWCRIVWWCYYCLRWTRTWWVTIRAGDLGRRKYVSSFIWRWCIVGWVSMWTPRLGIYILYTDASIKCNITKFKRKGATITTIGCSGISWRFSCSCPHCKESSAYITIIWSECDCECVCVGDDGPWFRCLSTMSWYEIVRVQLHPIITARSMIPNIEL